MKTKKLFIVISFLYILVPLLILIFPVLFQYKFYILTIFGILIYFVVRKFGISNKDLGIKKTNIIKSILSNLPICVVSIMIILLIRILGLNKFTPNETVYFYLFYIFISCPLQEFLYRGFFGYFDNGKNNILFLSSLLSSITKSPFCNLILIQNLQKVQLLSRIIFLMLD